MLTTSAILSFSLHIKGAVFESLKVLETPPLLDLV